MHLAATILVIKYKLQNTFHQTEIFPKIYYIVLYHDAINAKNFISDYMDLKQLDSTNRSDSTFFPPILFYYLCCFMHKYKYLSVQTLTLLK